MSFAKSYHSPLEKRVLWPLLVLASQRNLFIIIETPSVVEFYMKIFKETNLQSVILEGSKFRLLNFVILFIPW